jgi:hypothetical protein
MVAPFILFSLLAAWYRFSSSRIHTASGGVTRLRFQVVHLALQNLLISILVLVLERLEDRSVSAYRQRSVNRGAFRLSESSGGEIAMNEGNRHRTFAYR